MPRGYSVPVRHPIVTTEGAVKHLGGASGQYRRRVGQREPCATAKPGIQLRGLKA
jgi:hypothetical protein